MRRLIGLAAGILLVAPSAQAATITVDITADTVAADSHCSLREAVKSANSEAKRFAKVSKAGANAKKFSGRIGKRALKPGRYRATLVATDAAGNRSKAKRLRFRVMR